MDENLALNMATHRHYKGGLYRYVGPSRHSETLEPMETYEHLWPHEQGLWNRPAGLFIARLPDGRRKFEPLDPRVPDPQHCPVTWHAADPSSATHRHYKGGLYRFIGLSRHSETLEPMVTYEHLWPHEQGLWNRPADLFTARLPDGRRKFEPFNARVPDPEFNPIGWG